MKSKKTIISAFIAFFAIHIPAGLFAAAEYINPYSSEGQRMSAPKLDETWSWFMVSLVLLLILALALLIIIQIRVNQLTEKQRLRRVGSDNYKEKASWWELFVKAEKDQPLDAPIKGHDYDGIVELDNNPPAWFNWLFFLPIVWGVFYIMYFHVLNIGPLQEQEYEIAMEDQRAQMAIIEERRAKDLDNLEPLTDAAEIAAGKENFVKNCKTCHGAEAQGTDIAPNLTDKYWIHGGDFKSIYSTIYNGVDGKGMAAWGKILTFNEIVQISSYVESVRNTNVEGGMAPQGEEYNP